LNDLNNDHMCLIPLYSYSFLTALNADSLFIFYRQWSGDDFSAIFIPDQQHINILLKQVSKYQMRGKLIAYFHSL